MEYWESEEEHTDFGELDDTSFAFEELNEEDEEELWEDEDELSIAEQGFLKGERLARKRDKDY
ncbi:MAG: hypothetical protein QW559_00655 [Candidatus Woesearchaeota archaeon]